MFWAKLKSWQTPGIKIHGSMGSSYRRLKLLELLTFLEEALSREDDKEELLDLEKIRASLREEPRDIVNIGNGTYSLNIPEDESDCLDFLDIFTPMDMQWEFDEKTMDLLLQNDPK